MVETKFTPGPWRCDSAGVWSGTGWVLEPDSDKCYIKVVDMHIIAAAPDMYAALEAAISWRGLDGDGISDPVRKQLYAALAKARGEK